MTDGHVNEGLIGSDSATCISAVIRGLQKIQAVYVVRCRKVPLVQERVELSFGEQDILRRAMALRDDIGLPFWDAVMLSCFGSRETPTSLLVAARFHQSSRGGEVCVTSEDIGSGALHALSTDDDPTGYTAITSEVTFTDGSIGHLPMMDFHCPSSPDNLRLVMEVCRRVFSAGAFILESGESYHSYGKGTVTVEGLLEFLAECLLFVPIVDRAYVAHQIKERRCALRISRGGGKSAIPHVVAEV
jgi:hypothetical protein